MYVACMACMLATIRRYSYCSVLLEAPFDPVRRQMNSVLLTVDLTKAVADEAIERKDSVVIAYRAYTTSHHSESTWLTGT